MRRPGNSRPPSQWLSNMLELATYVRPPAPVRPAPSLPDRVRNFLFESQRRVILHCQQLLADDGLSEELRSRLARLADEAEMELRQLDR